jgi:hypothetical protein
MATSNDSSTPLGPWTYGDEKDLVRIGPCKKKEPAPTKEIVRPLRKVPQPDDWDGITELGAQYDRLREE